MPIGDQLLWDVGAGCASVAIEWMRTNPRCSALAIEKSKSRLKLIKKNASILGVPELKIISGRAPEVLSNLPAPDAVFVGGGVTSSNILETCWKFLKPGGRLVANTITLEGEQKLFNWERENYQNYGSSGSLTRIGIAHLGKIGRYKSWKEKGSITQLSVIKDYE